jgi:hypothetical protein
MRFGYSGWSYYWTTAILVLTEAVKAFPSADTRVRRYLGRFGSGELRFWPIVVIRTGWLASDPTIVYHAVSFHHAHPELRSGPHGIDAKAVGPLGRERQRRWRRGSSAPEGAGCRPALPLSGSEVGRLP